MENGTRNKGGTFGCDSLSLKVSGIIHWKFGEDFAGRPKDEMLVQGMGLSWPQGRTMPRRATWVTFPPQNQLPQLLPNPK